MEALANVSQLGVCELKNDELMEVDGGIVVSTAIAIIGFTYMIGYAAGKAYSHYQHSRKKIRRNVSSLRNNNNRYPNPGINVL
jgi:lactobin A/cerein 7B family class IIb bacteriocin